MTPSPTDALLQAKEAVLVDMREYVAEQGEDNAGYALDDVAAVGVVLEGFQSAWNALVDQPSREGLDAALSVAIEQLNGLNDRCDFCLIETHQRELLAAYFNQAAQALGLATPAEDVTEELRDW